MKKRLGTVYLLEVFSRARWQIGLVVTVVVIRDDEELLLEIREILLAWSQRRPATLMQEVPFAAK